MQKYEVQQIRTKFYITSKSKENTEITYSEIELNNNTLYTLFVDKQNNVYLYN